MRQVWPVDHLWVDGDLFQDPTELFPKGKDLETTAKGTGAGTVFSAAERRCRPAGLFLLVRVKTMDSNWPRKLKAA